MVAALQAIDELVLDKTSRKWKELLGNEFAHLVYDGRWFTPLKASVLAGAEALSEYATGEVVLKLYKGQVTPVQKRSPNSLYSESFATFGADEVYNQAHAEGFIRLYSLSSRIAALNKAK
jgi:argininosuccinate synthase